MSYTKDPVRYLESLASELSSRCDRVRLLIGDAHWYSDGSQKEAVLASVLKAYVQPRFTVSRAFLVAIDAANQLKVSREQDLVIASLDDEMPLFNENNLLIISPHAVKVTVSVKSGYSKRALEDCLDVFESVLNLPGRDRAIDQMLFTAFFFHQGRLTQKQCREIADETKKLLLRHGRTYGLKVVVCLMGGEMISASSFSNGEDSAVEIRAHYCGSLLPAVWIATVIGQLGDGESTGIIGSLLDRVDYEVVDVGSV